MRLLDRYLLRQLVPPLLFSFTALTSIMLLNQVAKKFGDLVGKGLPWGLIGEVFALCLPFIIAMTLPMAVLVAVLYAFSHLAADNEITAMRASGVSVGQMLAPVFLGGLLITGVNFVFTDQVLPRSNTRLRNLLISISRKKPTFELREQVINEIQPATLFLRASRIDPSSGRLKNVTIFDMGAADGRRVIYADSGRMSLSSGATDLNLRLFSGSIHEFKATKPSMTQLTYFGTNNIRVRDVSNQLELSAQDNVRGDREMSTCEMMDVVDAADRESEHSDRQRDILTRKDLQALLGLPPWKEPNPVEPPRLRGYCRWSKQIQHWLFPMTAQAETRAQPQDTTHKASLAADSMRKAPVSDVRMLKDSLRKAAMLRRIQAVSESVSRRAQTVIPSPRPVAPSLRPVLKGPALQPDSVLRPKVMVPLAGWVEVSSARENSTAASLRADGYAVEIHKKWAISVACLVFVIVGIPMALRFPRGGMGLVIGGALAVFSIHYVGLIAGEALGNKGLLSPAASMWGPDVLFTVLGIFGLWRVSRESGSTRGGDVADLIDTFFGWLRRRAR